VIVLLRYVYLGSNRNTVIILRCHVYLTIMINTLYSTHGCYIVVFLFCHIYQGIKVEKGILHGCNFVTLLLRRINLGLNGNMVINLIILKNIIFYV
jgi:hypothetical protein